MCRTRGGGIPGVKLNRVATAPQVPHMLTPFHPPTPLLGKKSWTRPDYEHVPHKKQEGSIVLRRTSIASDASLFLGRRRVTRRTTTVQSIFADSGPFAVERDATTGECRRTVTGMQRCIPRRTRGDYVPDALTVERGKGDRRGNWSSVKTVSIEIQK